MQKKGEEVAHAEDGIRLRKLKNSGRLRNSPLTGDLSAAKALIDAGIDVNKAGDLGYTPCT
jgi:hypothetical protein